MAFPTRLLHADEEVFLDERPHLVRLAAPGFVSLVGLAAIVAGFVLWHSAPTWFGLVLLGALVVIGSFFGARYVRWRATSLVVTSRRVILRSGVLRRVGREIPIDALQSVSFEQGIFERMLGAGTLTIESAGEHGEQVVTDVRDPEGAQAAVHAALAATGTQAEHGPEQGDLASRLERLEALHHRGVITALELERATHDLLGRS